MLRIFWTDRVSSVEVLNRMVKEMEVLYDVKRRRGGLIFWAYYSQLTELSPAASNERKDCGQAQANFEKNILVQEIKGLV